MIKVKSIAQEKSNSDVKAKNIPPHPVPPSQYYFKTCWGQSTLSVGTGEWEKWEWENNRRCKSWKCHVCFTIRYYGNLEAWAIWCTVNEYCYFCIRWWEIPLSFMVAFGWRIVALPPSPYVLAREAVRCLPEGSIVPSESQLALRKGGGPGKGNNAYSQQAKHICVHEWVEGCSGATAAASCSLSVQCDSTTGALIDFCVCHGSEAGKGSYS